LGSEEIELDKYIEPKSGYEMNAN